MIKFYNAIIYHMTEPRNVDAALGQMIHEKHGNAINILQTTAEIEKYLYNNMQKLQNKNNSKRSKKKKFLID